MAGRKPLGSKENAVSIVEQFMEHFKTNDLPVYTSKIWVHMSNASKGAWTPHSFYINVRDDRRDILKIARANHEITLPTSKYLSHTEFMNSSLDSTVHSDKTFNESDDPSFTLEEEAVGLDCFEIVVKNSEWKSLFEQGSVESKQTSCRILAKDVWTDVLTRLIWNQINLPCAYVIEEGHIYPTPGSLHHLRIKGHCKGYCIDKTTKQQVKCKNRLYVYVQDDPGNADVLLSVRTRNTMYIDHLDTRRPLRGKRRKEVGREVFYTGPGNWTKGEAAKVMDFGDRIPPHIPKPNVLRQAKKEYVHDKFNIASGDGKDVVLTIERMAREMPFIGSIHEIRRRPFYVSYSTPQQRHCYKRYCQLTKNLASAYIDGTGSLVKEIIDLDGTKSGHIFLYAIVVNFEGQTLPVHNMLTESQHTDTIEFRYK